MWCVPVFLLILSVKRCSNHKQMLCYKHFIFTLCKHLIPLKKKLWYGMMTIVAIFWVVYEVAWSHISMYSIYSMYISTLCIVLTKQSVSWNISQVIIVQQKISHPFSTICTSYRHTVFLCLMWQCYYIKTTLVLMSSINLSQSVCTNTFTSSKLRGDVQACK